MTAKTRMNALCMTLAVGLGLVSAYFLYVGHYGWALISIVGAVLCMETRVRMGYRGPRQAVFAVHLALSLAYLIALTHLSFGMHEPWAVPLAWFSFIGMMVSGAILIRQSWHPAT